MTLADLARNRAAVVTALRKAAPADSVAERLHELGFVAGEQVRVLAFGPLGKDPLVVQIGFTRFALRRTEAERILVQPA